MIVDVHCHAGYDYSFDDVYPPEKIIQKVQKYKDLIQIVQPGTTHSLEKAQRQHDEVYELAKSYPGKIIGMAAPNPHFEEKEYFGEIERCVKDLKFNSIKLRTFATATNPDSEAGRRVFRAAQKFKIPVLIHTGNGLPFASPIKILNVAKEFPDVSIIMSHTGAIILADEVPVVLSQCKNVYGDTSWAPGYLLMDWVKNFPNRFMFASDLADNFETELTKVKTYGFNPEEQKSIFQDTALEVFKIN